MEEAEIQEEEPVDEGQTPEESLIERRRQLKNKLLAVGRMSRVFNLLRYVLRRNNPTRLIRF